MSDVRRALRWLEGKRPPLREVVYGWFMANAIVWGLAVTLHETCGVELNEFARSVYRVVDLFRHVRDNFVSTRVFAELLEVRDRKFEDRNWSYFDSHAGVIFTPGVVRAITAMLQFSDADWRVCDACIAYIKSDEIQSGLVKNETADMLKDTNAKLVASLYKLRGTRPFLIKRLATYCHNLKTYAIGFGDENAIRALNEAEKRMRALGEVKPDCKNGRKIDFAVYSAFVYLNDGSKAVYKIRCRVNATTVVIRQPPPPLTRTEVAKAFFPGVDPALVKIMLRDAYESDLSKANAEGFKEGVLAAFKHVNLKDMILKQFKEQDEKLASTVQKGIDASLVGTMNVSGQRKVPQRAAAQRLDVNRITISRWIKWCETDGKEGVECPVPNFSPLLLESETAFDAWVPNYKAWKATGKKDRKKREPKTVTAAVKQDHDDIDEMFAHYSRGEM